MIIEQRRAKIIATLGPACSSKQQQLKLVEAGADVLRVNTSHLTPEQATELYQQLEELREQTARPFAVMADLGGPKLRLASSAPKIYLIPGQELTLSEKEQEAAIQVRVPGLASILKEGSEIVLGDGFPTLQVKEISNDLVKTVVIRAGRIRPRIGIALPGTKLNLPALTENDKQHIKAAAPYADWMAQSFVQNKEDLEQLHHLLYKQGFKARIMAKIERFSALQNLDEIIEVADAVMVARGDLGIEIGLAAVPFQQQSIIAACRAHAKPSVTATQVLESMIHADLPTRAEASDVAQALVQGTSALMLSAETATGDHPALAVEIMSQLITSAEQHLELEPQSLPVGASRTASMVRAADQLADHQNIPVMIIPNDTGYTARLAAALGRQQVIALCCDQQVARSLCMERGVTPLAWDGDHGTYLPLTAIRRAAEAGLIEPGQRVVVAWGWNSPESEDEMHLIAALSAK